MQGLRFPEIRVLLESSCSGDHSRLELFLGNLILALVLVFASLPSVIMIMVVGMQGCLSSVLYRSFYSD